MADPLFKRAWNLTIVPRGQSTGYQYTSAPKTGRPLRFTFTVEQTLHSHSNKASIVLYNLSQQTISAIDRGATVYLNCNYGDAVPDRKDNIFFGQVVERTTKMEGPDFATELVCGDSEFPLQEARLSVSFATGTTVKEILDVITKKLSITYGGEELGPKAVNLQGSFTQKINRYVAAGQAKKILDDLLHPRGIDWLFQGGTLIVQEPLHANQIKAVVLTSQTGLLERPVAGKKGVQFRALIQPRIKPAFPVQLQTSAGDCDGTFRVVQVTYHGDTHGGDWVLEAYADQLKKPLDPVEIPKKAKAGETAVGAEAQDIQADQEEMDEDDVDP